MDPGLARRRAPGVTEPGLRAAKRGGVLDRRIPLGVSIALYTDELLQNMVNENSPGKGIKPSRENKKYFRS